MKNTIKALKISIIFLLVFSSFVACDKDFSVIESDVLGKENANFQTNNIDIPISAYNKKLNALQINKKAGDLDPQLLGFFDDPEFGKTTASIITQVTPTAYSPDFGVNPVIDSVIISIPYFSRATGFDTEGHATYSIEDSLYGNAQAEIKLTIYHNNYFLRSFNPNSTTSPQNYFSNANSGINTTDNFALTENSTINFDDHKGAVIKDMTFTPSADAIKTAVGDGEDAVTTRSVPAFRTHLDNAFWKSTIIDHEGQPELSNASNFQDYFRGLYFKAEPKDGDGNMTFLNFASADAKITIHYSKGADDARTPSEYTFNFRGNRLNTFINDYSIPLADGDSDLGDETLYLKGAEGSMAIVDLFDNDPDALEDFLNDFRKTDDNGEFIKDNTTGTFVLKKLINEAQLVVYENDLLTTTSPENYHRYDRIYAYDVKNNTPIIDYNSFFDPSENPQDPFNSKIFHLGQRNPDQKKYKIRLTQHLNNILLRDSTNTKIGLVLSTNVNIITTAQTLINENGVTGIPAAAIFTPRGTILYGTKQSIDVPEEKRMKLNVFFTEPKDN